MSKLHTVSGGGTRSEKAPAFHLVPGFGYRRVAQRFGLGAEVHGPENWKESCQTESDARSWCNEAFNHMQEHVRKMLNCIEPDDDHIGAIGWCVEVLAYVEWLYGVAWTDLQDGGKRKPLKR